MKNLSCKNLKFSLLNVVTIVGLFVAPLSSKAQFNSVFTSMLQAVRMDTTAKITFSANATETSVYLKWTVTQQTKNGVYFIQKSVNGEPYKVVGLKEGIGSSIKKPLLYCYNEPILQEAEVKYRIVHVTENDIMFLKSAECVIKRKTENASAISSIPSKEKQNAL